MRLVRCTHCLRTLPMPVALDGQAPRWAGRCESCSGTFELARGDPVGDKPVSTPTRRLRFPRAARAVAEKWYAWRTSHEMLRWYQRVSGEEPQLTGQSLYEEVIVRRSRLDVETARGVLQRARQSFCEWPGPRKLRFRDVVHYVVKDEYKRAHSSDLSGTYIDMRRVVASIIPYHL